MENSIYHSKAVYNCLKQLNLCRIFPHTVIRHIPAVLIVVFSRGYKGKTVNFQDYSPCRRTTIAHFLNKGKWDSARLEDILQDAVAAFIYREALITGKPVFCIVDDTIASKTKPSSRALHPIEDAYFHQSHLKGKQDYGHQAVAVMLSCNGIVLNYAVVMYNKSISKIEIVKRIAGELPIPPVVSYFLCDNWYTSKDIIKAFLKRGFYTVGALRTNRLLYPRGIKCSIRGLALHIRKTDRNVSLVAAGSRKYYVYRYEGKLNGIEDATVLISYPAGAFHNPKALRAFICADTSLSTQEILDTYMARWPVEVYFRQTKNILAFDKYQIRSAKGICRYWLLMPLAHFICCTTEYNGIPFAKFESGYAFFSQKIRKERIEYFYRCGASGVPLEEVLTLVQ